MLVFMLFIILIAMNIDFIVSRTGVIELTKIALCVKRVKIRKVAIESLVEKLNEEKRYSRQYEIVAEGENECSLYEESELIGTRIYGHFGEDAGYKYVQVFHFNVCNKENATQIKYLLNFRPIVVTVMVIILSVKMISDISDVIIMPFIVVGAIIFISIVANGVSMQIGRLEKVIKEFA